MSSRRTSAAIAIAGALIVSCSEPATGPVTSDGGGSLWSDAASAAEERWSPGADLSIQMRINLVDSYGNETAEPALDLRWSGQDLARVNRDNVDRWMLLNLAEVTIQSPRGVIALSEWCTDDGLTLTPRLCRVARPAAEDDWSLRIAQQASRAP